MQSISFSNRLLALIHRRRLTLLGVGIALVLIVIAGAIYFVNATATPPSAADARLRTLVNQLNDPHLTAERHRAQEQLEQAGPAAVAPLTDALHSPNATLRQNSTEMLGWIASPRALDALVSTLKTDSAPAVRARAAWSLGELNDPRVIAPLERAAMLDSDPQVRQEAVASLDAERSRFAMAAGKDPQLVSAFAVAPSAPNVVYLAALNQLTLSRDGGKTGTALAATTPSRVTALAVSPANSSVLYAGTEALGLYKSTDGGTTWVAINQGLGLQPGVRLTVTALAVDPQNADHVYAARGVWIGGTDASLTPLGVAQSTDGGATWQDVSFPATRGAINRLLIDSNKLYASTPNQVVSVGI